MFCLFSRLRSTKIFTLALFVKLQASQLKNFEFLPLKNVFLVHSWVHGSKVGKCTQIRLKCFSSVVSKTDDDDRSRQVTVRFNLESWVLFKSEEQMRDPHVIPQEGRGVRSRDEASKYIQWSRCVQWLHWTNLPVVPCRLLYSCFQYNRRVFRTHQDARFSGLTSLFSFSVVPCAGKITPTEHESIEMSERGMWCNLYYLSTTSKGDINSLILSPVLHRPFRRWHPWHKPGLHDQFPSSFSATVKIIWSEHSSTWPISWLIKQFLFSLAFPVMPIARGPSRLTVSVFTCIINGADRALENKFQARRSNSVLFQNCLHFLCLYSRLFTEIVHTKIESRNWQWHEVPMYTHNVSTVPANLDYHRTSRSAVSFFFTLLFIRHF